MERDRELNDVSAAVANKKLNGSQYYTLKSL